MRKFLNHFSKQKDGASAAEFALVLPLLIIFLLGIIDVGRFMWTWNRAEKATQMGARFAVVADMVPANLYSYSFAVSGGIPQGQPVPKSAFGGATCTSTTCACVSGGTCPALGFSSAAFNNILARVQAFMPEVQAANLEVDYLYSGLGFSGDPNGSNVAPIVRVRLINMPDFKPLLGTLFGLSIALPDFAYSLTLEDGSGTVSN